MMRLSGFLLVVGILCTAYLSTLQTIPNGSSHYFMIDVGETQIVLNEWGTLHATGYPLYVILGNVLTTILTVIGFTPVVAPAVVSLFWGLITTGLLYILLLHLMDRVLLAVAGTLLFGLTRIYWLHHVIAETYTFGMALLVGLFVLALWCDEIPGLTTFPARIYWMALLGGVGVAHHRMIMFVIPALLFAVWPYFQANWRRMPSVVGVSLALGLLGFLPYMYLPLREFAGADWVYGEPGNLSGFLDQFLGREADQFLGGAESLVGLFVNFENVTQALIDDITLPGLLVGLLGLGFAIWRKETGRVGVVFALSGAASYGFHVFFFHVDPLPALTLPATLALIVGWIMLADAWLSLSTWSFQVRQVALVSVIVLLSTFFILQNEPFVSELTDDSTGLQTIEALEVAPQAATVMLAWGPRYFAASLAQDLQGELDHIDLVDNSANFSELLADNRMLLTPEYTFFNQPPEWWQARLGSQVYLGTVQPGLVQIRTDYDVYSGEVDTASPQAVEVMLSCDADKQILEIVWVSQVKPEQDLSVFVHLLDGDGQLIAQDDRSAPVYGWRPLTTWEAGERVRDSYVLPMGGQQIRFGLYRQAADGAFINEVEYERASCISSSGLSSSGLSSSGL